MILTLKSDLFSSVPYDTVSLTGLSEMISISARNLRTLHVNLRTLHVMTTLMLSISDELKALAGNNVLQVLKISFVMGGCESECYIEDAFRSLEEVLMDPGWSALVCVSIDIEVECCREAAKRKMYSVPEMYLGRLLSRKILSYECEDFVYNFVE